MRTSAKKWPVAEHLGRPAQQERNGEGPLCPPTRGNQGPPPAALTRSWLATTQPRGPQGFPYGRALPGRALTAPSTAERSNSNRPATITRAPPTPPPLTSHRKKSTSTPSKTLYTRHFFRYGGRSRLRRMFCALGPVLGQHGDTPAQLRLRSAPSDPNPHPVFIGCSERLGPVRQGHIVAAALSHPCASGSRPWEYKRRWGTV